MIDLGATVTGLAPLRAFLAALPGRLADATAGGAGEAADALRDALEAGTPKKTGATSRAWRVRLTRQRAVVENPSNVALFLDQGTRRMRARPYVRAAIDQTAPGRERIFQVRVRRALR